MVIIKKINKKKLVLCVLISFIVICFTIYKLAAVFQPFAFDRAGTAAYFQGLENQDTTGIFGDTTRGWISCQTPRHQYTASEFYVPLDTKLRQVKYIDYNSDGNDEDSIINGTYVRLGAGASGGQLEKAGTMIQHWMDYAGARGEMVQLRDWMYGGFDGCYVRGFPFNTDTQLLSQSYGDWNTMLNQLHTQFPTFRFYGQFTTIVTRDCYGGVMGRACTSGSCSFAAYYNGRSSPDPYVNTFFDQYMPTLNPAYYTWNSIPDPKLCWYSCILDHTGMFFVNAYNYGRAHFYHNFDLTDDVVGVCWQDPNGNYGQSCSPLAGTAGTQRLIQWCTLNHIYIDCEGDAAGAVQSGTLCAYGWDNGHNEMYSTGGPYIPYFSLTYHEVCMSEDHHNGGLSCPKTVIEDKRYGAAYIEAISFPDIGPTQDYNNQYEIMLRFMVAHTQDNMAWLRFILGAQMLEHYGGTGEFTYGIFRKNVYGGNHPYLPNPPWITYDFTDYVVGGGGTGYAWGNSSLYGHSVFVEGPPVSFIEFDEFLDHCDGRGLVQLDANKTISIESGEIVATASAGAVNPLEIHYQAPDGTNMIGSGVGGTPQEVLCGDKPTTLRRIPQIKITPSSWAAITLPYYGADSTQLSLSGAGNVNVEVDDNPNQYYSIAYNIIIPVTSMTSNNVTKLGRFRVTNGVRYQISRGTTTLAVATAVSSTVTFNNINIDYFPKVYKIEPAKVYALSVVVDTSSLIGNGTSTTVIRAYLQDFGGQIVPTATNQVIFNVTGPGTLIGTNSVTAVGGVATITLQAATSPGTVNITATVNGLNTAIQHIYAIDMGATNTGSGAYVYRDFSPYPGYVIASGDYLEYEIYIPVTSINGNAGVDVEISGVNLRDTGATDQNGISAHPSTDLSPYAKGQWYYRKIPIPSSFNGKTIKSVPIAFGSLTGASEVYVRNLRITNSGSIQFTFHNETKMSNFAAQIVSPINATQMTMEGGIQLTTFTVYNINSSTNIVILPSNPVKLSCSANQTTPVANGISISTITAVLKDAYNNVVQTATNTVIYSITGNGTWDDGTVTDKQVISINGLSTVKVKSTTAAGGITVNVNSSGLIGSTVTITTMPGLPRKLKIRVY